MKLTIFGASGRTGIHLLEQALEAGHDVRAAVRNPAKIKLNHARLQVVQTDLYTASSLEAAMAGAGAVLSALGPLQGGPKDVMTVAARNIVAGMNANGVRRLVTLTGAGVDQPGDQPKLINKCISFMLRTLQKDILIDSVEHVRIVRESDLDWTIVRVPVLGDGPRTGKYRVGMVGINDGVRISRADVAEFMLKQLEPGAEFRIVPVISY